ncbi:hypothetical protein AVEN_132025-1 [Araneus ventricosus]|uniref:Uncharacterized protein n=1 Tax=Araneus ventricosus TaxID=182803 RepID=A0A4Y2B5G8_ARAVE|nr:hypothetical protein AVEN_132025-1 [Araneus ventricosus]
MLLARLAPLCPLRELDGGCNVAIPGYSASHTCSQATPSTGLILAQVNRSLHYSLLRTRMVVHYEEKSSSLFFAFHAEPDEPEDLKLGRRKRFHHYVGKKSKALGFPSLT